MSEQHTGGGNSKGRRASFGSIRKLPSGRLQARYAGPDGITRNAPTTFDTRGDANTWLSMQRADIARGTWLPESVKRDDPTFTVYAEAWLADREIRERTRELYRSILDRHLLPAFGTTTLRNVTMTKVKHWHATFGRSLPEDSKTRRAKRGETGATARAHAYSLLRTILNSAIDDELIAVNPCRVRGATTAKRTSSTEPATLDQLATIVNTIPEHYRAMILLATWCGLRFGELAELRRRDIDVKAGVVRVRRAVVRLDGKPVVGLPKSDAGIRDVNIPPHLLPSVRDHFRQHAAWGADGLLFPARSGEHLHPTTLHRVFKPAREAAGRPDLRFHDLRHTGAVLAAQTGATLAELMARLGHSTPNAALRYQHAAQGRDAVIAARLSKLAQESIR